MALVRKAATGGSLHTGLPTLYEKDPPPLPRVDAHRDRGASSRGNHCLASQRLMKQPYTELCPQSQVHSKKKSKFSLLRNEQIYYPHYPDP